MTGSTGWCSAAGLSARQVTVLRLYAKCCGRPERTFSQAYMEDTLSGHPEIARRLVRLFETRFDPAPQPVPRSRR